MDETGEKFGILDEEDKEAIGEASQSLTNNEKDILERLLLG